MDFLPTLRDGEGDCFVELHLTTLLVPYSCRRSSPRPLIQCTIGNLIVTDQKSRHSGQLIVDPYCSFCRA